MKQFDLAQVNAQRQLPPADPKVPKPAMATPNNAHYKHRIYIVQDPPEGQWIHVELDAQRFVTTWTTSSPQFEAEAADKGGDSVQSELRSVVGASHPETLAARPPPWDRVYRRVTRDIDKDCLLYTSPSPRD